MAIQLAVLMQHCVAVCHTLSGKSYLGGQAGYLWAWVASCGAASGVV